MRVAIQGTHGSFSEAAGALARITFVIPRRSITYVGNHGAEMLPDQPLVVRESYTDDTQEKAYANADVWYWGFSGEDLKYSMRAYYYHHEQQSFFNPDDADQSIPGNEAFGFMTRAALVAATVPIRAARRQRSCRACPRNWARASAWA